MNYSERFAANRRLLSRALEVEEGGERFELLAKRFAAERDLFKGPVLERSPGGVVATLVLLVDEPIARRLDLTLRLWSLQSCPHVRAIVLPCRSAVPELVKDAVDESSSDLDVRQVSELSLETLADTDFVVFARPGHLFHPSLATLLALIHTRERASIVVWNDARYVWDGDDPGPVVERVRRPRLERHTLRHVPYVGSAFAVQPTLIGQYPYSLLDHLLDVDGHAFHLWIAERTDAVWSTHPECLSMHPIDVVRHGRHDGRLIDAYREILKPLEQDFSLMTEPRGALPYRLEPRRPPSVISVIIPFRDRADQTCRCLGAVFKQRTSARLEVVLVDNLSSPADAMAVRSFADRPAGDAKIKVLEYPHPFNHSQQTMLGVEASSGEVVVFLNNDAELVSPTALEEMARWALVPGVATVGCRIMSPKERLVSAGVRAVPGQCGYRESEELAYSTEIRETLGNSFACAAITRQALDALGPLDGLEFPNGYNDVEFCLRARSRGYCHIYLGHLNVHHVPATTRGRMDESLQQLLLTIRFPEGSQAALFQLERQSTGEGTRHADGLQRVSVAFQQSWLGRRLRAHPLAWRAALAVFKASKTLLGVARQFPLAVERRDGTIVRLEIVTECPDCHSRAASHWRTGRDRSLGVVRGDFPYVRCRRCGLIYLSLRPTKSESLKVYPGDYPPYLEVVSPAAIAPSPVEQWLARIESRASASLRRRLRKALRSRFPDQLAALLGKFYTLPGPGATLLDFGCGSARFLNEARSNGWHTIGMDASLAVVEEVRRRGHRAMATEDGWKEIEDSSLDVARLNHVIEHLYDPETVFELLRRKLRPGGRIHIATPNPAGISSRLFRSYWWGLETPRHAMLYTPRVLKKWLERLGFADVQTVPECTAKDFARSLGYVLEARRRIEHAAVESMATEPLLREWAELIALLAARLGSPDRFHVFARRE
jgi:GT2 family glycosyltransferase/SAM-dependent methyltransferase